VIPWHYLKNWSLRTSLP